MPGRKKKEKQPAEDWLLKSVAGHGIVFRVFASFVVFSNTVAVVLVLTLFYRSGIFDFVPEIFTFYVVLAGTACAVGFVLILAFLLGIETFDPDNEVADDKKL